MTTTTTTTTKWVADWLLAARRRNILSTFGQMNIFPGCWTPRTETEKFINLWEKEWKWEGVINALLNRRHAETTKNKIWETILSILTSDLLAGSTFQGFLFRLLGRLHSQCKRSAPGFKWNQAVYFKTISAWRFCSVPQWDCCTHRSPNRPSRRGNASETTSEVWEHPKIKSFYLWLSSRANLWHTWLRTCVADE